MWIWVLITLSTAVCAVLPCLQVLWAWAASTRFWGTDSDDMVLRCSPLAYLQENGIANKLALTKAEENCLILCAGQGAYEGDALDDTQALADLLKDQGMPAHLEIWGGDVSHDWYWWGKMWSLFAPRILEK